MFYLKSEKKTFKCIRGDILSVSASEMSATVEPAAFATLGSDIDIVCLSDEANPTATIEWSLNGVTPEATDITDNACCNARKRQSKITIQNVQRSNNGRIQRH